MKAIVFKDLTGFINYIFVSDKDRVESTFKEMCVGSGVRYCANKDDFEKLKKLYGIDEITEKLTEIAFKEFIGVGLYDTDGNFYTKLIDKDGEIWVDDYVEMDTHVGAKIIDYKQSLSLNDILILN